MRTMSLVLVTLVVSGSVAAAQTATAPRIDGEGINMDAPPPPTREPSHPADGYAPKASNPSAATTGQAPKDTRPVPKAGLRGEQRFFLTSFLSVQDE